MGRFKLQILVASLLPLYSPAAATNFTAVITGEDGKPLPNAVVSLETNSPSAPSSLASRFGDATIDQRKETFIPLVTIVPKGGRVKFANNDPTTHQVYSFSKTKQFELTLARGEASAIAFENTGIAALGCNIHDNMIAYVFVADSPYTVLTNDDGQAVIKDVPPGGYRVQVWHPKQRPGSETPSVELALAGDAIRWEATMKVLPPRTARSHGGNY